MHRFGLTAIGFSAVALTLASTASFAEVSTTKAETLGSELTPMGSNPDGNAAGTIPEWIGGDYFTDEEKSLSHEDLLRLQQDNPDDLNFVEKRGGENAKLRFTITADNYQEYADQLSAGHKRLFEMNPSYKMRVFPTVRTAFFPERIYEETRKNATRATLEGVNDISGAKLGLPFPIPTNGAQAVWNHKLKFRGSAVKRYNNQAVVDADGSYQLTKLIEDVKFEYGNLRDDNRRDNIFVYYLQRVLSPTRLAGQITLVHEIFGKGTSGRNAWIYTPGLDRVNRAPDVGYDTPSNGSDGLQFNDQINMFNGSLGRYTWKLKGKQEMFIPYNSYKMSDPRLTYDQIIQKGHINQDYPRYELHRVWVVEATLRDGTRHQLAKRVFYIDEDSWTIVMVDGYDNRDQLWKFQEGHLLTAPFIPTATTIPEIIYDLQSGRYFVTAMSNEDKPNDTSVSYERKEFSPRNLRSLGTKY